MIIQIQIIALAKYTCTNKNTSENTMQRLAIFKCTFKNTNTNTKNSTGQIHVPLKIHIQRIALAKYTSRNTNTKDSTGQIHL